MFVAQATKVIKAGAEIAGTCILISDQTVTPFWVRLEISVKENLISHYHFKVGEPGTGQLGISGPPSNSKEAQHLLVTLMDRLDDVRWTFEVSPLE